MVKFHKTGRLQKLLMLAAFLLLGHAGFAQVLVNEDFSTATGTTPPTGWQNIDNAGEGDLWAFDNPGARDISGGNPGFSGNFAILDGDYYGFTDADAELITPAFDASLPGTYKLSYDNQIRYIVDQTCQVDVWDGTQWNNVYNNTANDGYPNPANHKDLDITAAAGGYNAAMVRFHFIGYYRWWWALDNVSVTRNNCTNPAATFSTVPDCANNQYFIAINLTSLGDAPTVNIYDGATLLGSLAATGTTNSGPFISGTTHTLTIVNGNNSACNISSPAQVAICNDECAGATPLTVNPDLNCGIVAQATTNGATASLDAAPTCGTAGTSNDVWFTFVAAGTTQQISFSNFASSSTTQDLEASVYSGTCGNFIEVTCSDPETFYASGLTPGDTYYLRVGTYGSGGNATFDVCIGTPPPPPSNDDCGTAIGLTVNLNLECGTVTHGTTLSATSSAEAALVCDPAGANDDVWYYFVATASSQLVSFSNVTGTTSDLVAAVYDGTCGNLTSVTCSDPESFTVSGLTPGMPYLLQVFTYSSDPSEYADFDVCIGTFPSTPPANDECAAATPIGVNLDLNCGTVLQGTTLAATASSQAAPSCGTAGTTNDIWYSFVAGATAQQISFTNFTASSSTQDLEASVYSGTCGALTEITCSDPETFAVIGLTPGDTYYLRVGTYSSGQYATFDVCIGTYAPGPPAPANDDCAGAIAAAVNADTFCTVTTSGTTTGATQSSEVAPACGTDGINDDVWYTFTTNTGTAYRISFNNITGTSSDLAAAVYSGTCGNLTELTCSDPQTFDVTGLSPNTTYYLRVWTYSSDPTDSANFDVCIRTLPPAPGNDDCTNAIALQCNTTVTGTTTSSVNDSLTNLCNQFVTDQTSGGVWYTFTGNGGGVTLSTCNAGTNFDTRLNVFSGSCGNFVCEAGDDDDDNCNTLSSSTVTINPTVAGQTYYVLVHGYSTHTGDFELSMACSCTPPVVNLGNDTILCAGNALTLDAGNAGDTYIFSDGSTNQTLDVTQAGQYYVTVSTTDGCSASDTIVVDFLNGPIVNLGNDTTICQGQTLTLDAGISGTSYLYNDGSTNETLDVATGGAYSVVVTGPTGCTTSDTINVTVNQYPVVNLGNDTSICTNSSITLDAGLFLGTYMWSDGSNLETLNVSAPGTYSVTVTVAGGCSGSDSIEIFQLPTPVVNLGNDTSICAGSTITLDAGNAGDTYLYNDGSGNQTLDVTTAGQYYVTVSNLSGCSASDTINVSVNVPASVTGITFTNTGLDYTFNATGVQNANTIDWNFGDGGTGQGMPVTHLYAAEGTYPVMVIVSNECGSDTATLDVTLGVATINVSEAQLSMYPNPAKDEVTIENKAGLNLQNISVINTLGQVITSNKMTNTKVYQLSTANLATGIYTIRIQTDKGFVVRRLQVER